MQWIVKEKKFSKLMMNLLKCVLKKLNLNQIELKLKHWLQFKYIKEILHMKLNVKMSMTLIGKNKLDFIGKKKKIL